MKKIFSFFLLFLLAFSILPCYISAEEISENDINDIDKATAVYLYSYDADRVIFSKGGDKKLYPASTVKMMTGLLVCEVYSDKLSQVITITPDMLKAQSGTSMNLKVGMTLKIEDLLYGTVCGVNNDAATALAIACAGSIEAFVEQMNKYARAWDMRDTIFSNPTGIDSDDAHTTIVDIAKLSKKAADNQLYIKISSTEAYEVNGTDIIINNRNALMSQFSAQGYLNKNATGLIAGGTDNGGFVLSTLATKNENRLLCIVMGAESDVNDIYSYKIANSLIDIAFDSYSSKKIAELGKSFGEIKINNALIDKNGASVNGILKEDIYAFVPKHVDIDVLEFKPYFHNTSLNAPISKGANIGGVLVYYDDVIVAEGILVADKDIDPNSLLTLLDNIRNFFIGRKFILTLIIAIPTIIFYLLIHKNSHRKRATTVRFKNYY